MSAQERAAPATPRFGTDGRIVAREREDGTIWCPKCKTFLPRERFSRNAHRRYSAYCHTCDFRKRQARLARNPKAYARMLARDSAGKKCLVRARGEAVHREYLAMTQVAIERLRAIGLRYSEISQLCDMRERVLEDLRKPNHRAQRPTMDKVLALFRVASDIEHGPNRLHRYAPHDYYDVLERRMVEPLEEIAEARRQGRYRQPLGRNGMGL